MVFKKNVFRFGRRAPSKQIKNKPVLRALGAQTDGNLFLKFYSNGADIHSISLVSTDFAKLHLCRSSRHQPGD